MNRRVVVWTRTEEHPGVCEEVPLRTVQRLCKVRPKPPTNTDVYGVTSRSIDGTKSLN
jgi:hypothetical protein